MLGSTKPSAAASIGGEVTHLLQLCLDLIVVLWRLHTSHHLLSANMQPDSMPVCSLQHNVQLLAVPADHAHSLVAVLACHQEVTAV